MKTTFGVLAASLCAVLASGCSCGGIRRPATSDLVVSGTVSLLSGGSTSPLSGARVEALVDGAPAGSVESDADGKYRLQTPIERGQRAVVQVSAAGAATAFRTLDAGRFAEIPLNVVLRELDPLECGAGAGAAQDRCEIEGGRLSLQGLDPAVSGSARLFNPVREQTAFPGAFADSAGNLLLSGVFSATELQDGQGDPLEVPDESVGMRMRVPADTWPILSDIQPGDDRIQVPLFAFEEESGEWVRDGEGHLEDSSGAIIPEARLADIRAGTFEQGVMAAGRVGHFSYWNVDWPVETKQCLKGIVHGDDGRPAEGATVMVSGVTYNGTSTPQTVGADGTFCVEVMRSDHPGEDVDQDGIPGETQRVRIRVAYGGLLYDGGTFDVPRDDATCSTTGCLDVGTLALTPASELQPGVCAVKGRVLDSARAPVAGVQVSGFDAAIGSEMYLDLCGFAMTSCTLFATSGPDGRYAVSAPYVDALTLFAMVQEQDAQVNTVRYAMVTLDGCPPGDVDLVMDEGYEYIEFALSLQGQRISWAPAAIPAHLLFVQTPDGQTKWAVSSEGGFMGPVTYGVVPAGAQQDEPFTGAPPPLASGDRITLHSNRERDGIPSVGMGELDVP